MFVLFVALFSLCSLCSVVNPLWRSQFPFYFLHFTFYIRVGCQRLFNFLGFDRWSLNNAAQWEQKEVIITIDKSPLTSLSLFALPLCPLRL
jgi:hypothetical protein